MSSSSSKLITSSNLSELSSIQSPKIKKRRKKKVLSSEAESSIGKEDNQSDKASIATKGPLTREQRIQKLLQEKEKMAKRKQVMQPSSGFDIESSTKSPAKSP